ncbi:hypothetical protein MIND_01210400 [Mycena indigotica]|uniref:Uncharacterized protein n=1 Tax=Mycena indigotica TaxID=2126181 RepID=A0A8H6S4W2_9AGAR|nr:uncharacterized protein MIND_01210400 [Mycena indigotica]KAF7291852.1 hypothetical protein MIND_01210400 [Mycena indigotica]
MKRHSYACLVQQANQPASTPLQNRTAMATPNIAELVIREISPVITIFSKPFSRFGLLPFGGRSTAVKLSTGDVWVLASTPLTEDTKATIDKLGPVKWIIGADAVHHLYLGQFKTVYPDAKVIGVAALVSKKAKEGLVLDGVYGADPVEAKYGFEEEIYACYFDGFANKDIAFFHVASRTLIVADLLFNLPGTEQYSKAPRPSKSHVPLVGKIEPFGSLHKRFVWSQGKDKKAMARDAKTVLEWAPERVIMCHGDVIETSGTEAWAAAYSKYLA